MSESVGARTHLFSLSSKRLEDLVRLPDEDAARELQCRLAGIERVEELHERSYAEILVIAGEFDKRKLWQCVENPVSGEPFNSWSAWATAAGPRCRRVMMEAKRDASALSDVPTTSLIGVSKDNIKVLKQLSTKVRNEPQILEAAKTLPADQFIAKIETEKPDQHIESRQWFRAHLERSVFEKAEKLIAFAIESGRADTRAEAVERIFDTAEDEWVNEGLQQAAAGAGSHLVQ
jgi:hypothetical protein